jgi:hypothetical protein
MNRSEPKRENIAIKAANFYIDNPDFTMKELATHFDIPVSDLYKLFPNRNSVLKYYYTVQFRNVLEITQNIDGYQNFSLAEKLSTIAYTLIDLLLEDREFVDQTFTNLICKSHSKTDFEKELDYYLKTTFNNDQRISASASIIMNSWFYSIIRKHYMWLITYWLNDESNGFENTMAITDKWTSLLQELLYNSIIDKSLDLTKFMFAQSNLKEWIDSFEGNRPSSSTRSEL